MKFSLWPNADHSPAETLDLARWIDGEGWHGMWFADHYMPNTGDTSSTEGDYHECWGLIPAVAAVTATVRVGSLVAPTSVHHPALLANRAATIDHISAGRMVLGLGAGWQINEHVAYGIELEPPGRRVSRFEESIQIIRSLLANERTTFDGEVYQIINAPCNPKPVQPRLPILVGTKSPRMLGIAARYADEWNTWGDPAMAIENRHRFVQTCDQLGVDITTKHTTVNALVTLSDNQSVIDTALSGPMGTRSIAGSAEHLRDQLGRYRDAGFDEFILPDWNLGDAPSDRKEAIARIKSEVFDQTATSTGNVA